MMRDVTGLNEARDGSKIDPDSLVGLQKLAAANSNTATRHVLDASLQITKALAEGLSCRISDILEYSEFKEEFAMQIGKYNVATLEDTKDLYLYDFGIFIELSPDEEEKAQLEANIQTALSRDQIHLEDAIDIRDVKNLKVANQLLKLKRKKKEENDIQKSMMQQQTQAQVNQQSQAMAAEAALAKIEAEKRSKMELKQAEIAFDIEKMKNEAALKSQLMQLEFDMNMQLKGIEVDSLQKREDNREKAKADRISQQNTQQSKLIDQRKNNLPPMSFESNEDSLDGFDLAEFEPR